MVRNHIPSSWPKNKPASFIWRSILDTKEVLEKGIKWVIGDGKTVSIWHDWWCGDKPLAISHPGEHTRSTQKVDSLIVDGNWILDEITQYVDEDVLEAIMDINFPTYTQNMDHPIWVGSTNGNFSVDADYDIVNKDSLELKSWKWFWKIKMPQKFKIFVWLIFHNSLATNQLRNRRGIAESDLCPRCNAYSETIKHLFRECDKAKNLWNCIPSCHLMRGDMDTPILD